MRLGSLCTGYGGLDMAAHALVPDAELAFVSDNDTHVSRFLATRFPDVSNLGDFTQLDRLPDCDILTAGFPCQPVSHAGKRKGTDDDRWLWDDIERVLGGMERPPGLLLLENVRGLLSANGGDAMGRVVEGLASLGYVGRYRVLAASDVGAPHRRDRVFIVAAHGDRQLFDRAWTTGARGWSESSDGGDAASDPKVNQQREQAKPGPIRPELGHGTFGPYAPAVARWEQILGRPAPDPTTGQRLNPRFVEWMMGLPDGWVTGLDLSRTAQLKMLGNGVVPQQAYAAYRSLL